MKTDGSGFELPQHAGWPDNETFPYESGGGVENGGWMDSTTDGGVLYGDTPVIIYRDSDSWIAGLVLVAMLPFEVSGVVSMNWRSAQRGHSGQRVHVG
jgi:hypothetical protein